MHVLNGKVYINDSDSADGKINNTNASRLIKGRKYGFNASIEGRRPNGSTEWNNSDYEIYISTDKDGNNEYTGGWNATTNEILWTIPNNFPEDKVYFHCRKANVSMEPSLAETGVFVYGSSTESDRTYDYSDSEAQSYTDAQLENFKQKIRDMVVDTYENYNLANLLKWTVDFNLYNPTLEQHPTGDWEWMDLNNDDSFTSDEWNVLNGLVQQMMNEFDVTPTRAPQAADGYNFVVEKEVYFYNGEQENKRYIILQRNDDSYLGIFNILQGEISTLSSDNDNIEEEVKNYWYVEIKLGDEYKTFNFKYLMRGLDNKLHFRTDPEFPKVTLDVESTPVRFFTKVDRTPPSPPLAETGYKFVAEKLMVLSDSTKNMIYFKLTSNDYYRGVYEILQREIEGISNTGDVMGQELQNFWYVEIEFNGQYQKLKLEYDDVGSSYLYFKTDPDFTRGSSGGSGSYVPVRFFTKEDRTPPPPPPTPQAAVGYKFVVEKEVYFYNGEQENKRYIILQRNDDSYLGIFNILQGEISTLSSDNDNIEEEVKNYWYVEIKLGDEYKTFNFKYLMRGLDNKLHFRTDPEFPKVTLDVESTPVRFFTKVDRTPPSPPLAETGYKFVAEKLMVLSDSTKNMIYFKLTSNDYYRGVYEILQREIEGISNTGDVMGQELQNFWYVEIEFNGQYQKLKLEYDDVGSSYLYFKTDPDFTRGSSGGSGSYVPVRFFTKIDRTVEKEFTSNVTEILKGEIYTLSDTNPVSISGGLIIQEGGKLIINNACKIVVEDSGLVQNYGNIENLGTIENKNRFENYYEIINKGAGTINNTGTIDNNAGIINESTINNKATATAKGTINNKATNTQRGVIFNNGTINNEDTCTINNQSDIFSTLNGLTGNGNYEGKVPVLGAFVDGVGFKPFDLIENELIIKSSDHPITNPYLLTISDNNVPGIIITHKGSITIENGAWIEILEGSEGTVINNGTITNNGTFFNRQTLKNNNIIKNTGIFENDRIINNAGTITISESGSDSFTSTLNNRLNAIINNTGLITHIFNNKTDFVNAGTINSVPQSKDGTKGLFTLNDKKESVQLYINNQTSDGATINYGTFGADGKFTKNT